MHGNITCKIIVTVMSKLCLLFNPKKEFTFVENYSKDIPAKAQKSTSTYQLRRFKGLLNIKHETDYKDLDTNKEAFTADLF